MYFVTENPDIIGIGTDFFLQGTYQGLQKRRCFIAGFAAEGRSDEQDRKERNSS
jgi:hypothetical protein